MRNQRVWRKYIPDRQEVRDLEAISRLKQIGILNVPPGSAGVEIAGLPGLNK